MPQPGYRDLRLHRVVSGKCARIAVVRCVQQFKYVYNGFDFDELYDLESDPHEMHNLAPDPAYADLLREMARRMWQRTRETGDFNVLNSHYGMFRYAPVGPVSAS